MNKLTAIELLVFLAEASKRHQINKIKIKGKTVSGIYVDDVHNTIQIETSEHYTHATELLKLLRSFTHEKVQRPVRIGESFLRAEIVIIGHDALLVREEDWGPTWGEMNCAMLHGHLSDMTGAGKVHPIHIHDRVVSGARILGGRLVLRTDVPDTSLEFLSPIILTNFLNIYSSIAAALPVYVVTNDSVLEMEMIKVVGASDITGQLVLQTEGVNGE